MGTISPSDVLENNPHVEDLENERLAEIWKPPPKVTASEWADRERVLSRDYAAEPGRWHTDRAPYQRGIMDAFSEPTVQQIVVMSSAQVGKTEILKNVMGFYAHHDPAPILVIQPNVKPMAEDFSKRRLAPMLRDTPCFKGQVADPRSRDTGNTITYKQFANGASVAVIGANSAAGLASRPIRVILADEVDRFPASAGTEGDPVELAKKRTRTFWNRKVGLFSTPGIKGMSRIEDAWEESDQRQYYVPCPECGTMQIMEWKDENGEYRLIFERDPKGRVIPESVGYRCAACPAIWEEADKLEILRHGQWVAAHPERPVAGFRLWAGYSPWMTWVEIVEEFLDAKQRPERLKVFVTTVLGETWEERGELPESTSLMARLEDCPADVPDGVGILTAAVDVQIDRLEILVVGWGVDEESWRILHERVQGSPDGASAWERVEHFLVKPYHHVSGRTLRIQAAAIDTGYHAKRVYAWVRPRQKRNVFAIKGATQPHAPILGNPSRRDRHGIRLFPVGGNAAKDALFARLRTQEPGPGYMHFLRQPDGGGLDAAFFQQYGAERKVKRQVAGRFVGNWEQISDRPNEAIDLEVYNMAALQFLGRGITKQLEKYVERARAPVDEEEKAAPTKRPRRKPKGWLHGWK